jgi:hypothetical protein
VVGGRWQVAAGWDFAWVTAGSGSLSTDSPAGG